MAQLAVIDVIYLELICYSNSRGNPFCGKDALLEAYTGEPKTLLLPLMDIPKSKPGYSNGKAAALGCLKKGCGSAFDWIISKNPTS